MSPHLRASRERLAALLWGDSPDPQARSSLRQSLAVLRRELGGWGESVILSDDQSLALNPASVSTDICEFNALQSRRDLASLRRASAINSGDLLADLAITDPLFRDWLDAARREFRTLREDVLEKLCQIDAGEPKIEAARALVALDPMRESAHRHLMMALADVGETALALAQFERCRAVLAAEFRIAPGAETLHLRDEIAAGRAMPGATVQRSLGRSPVPASKLSVIVLPFAASGGEPDQEYLGDGIAEDIATDLTRISGLTVLSRSTSLTYKGKTESAQTVCRETGASHVLTGSVRRLAQRTRISCELSEGASGLQIWADRFDRDLIDIFEIQNEIARSIAAQLRVKLLSHERQDRARPQAGDFSAYDFYLRGRDFLRRHTKAYYHLAKRMFATSIEHDPKYARSYAGLVECDSALYLLFDEPLSREDILANSARALAIDDMIAETHASRGLALFTCEMYDEAERELLRAMEIAPQFFDAYFNYARICYNRGDMKTAAVMFEKAIQLNPDDYECWVLVVQIYKSLDRHGDMLNACRRGVELAKLAIEQNPENPRPLYLGAGTLAVLGEFDLARQWANRALALDPDDRLARYNIACMYCYMGELDLAMALLEDVLPQASHDLRSVALHDSDLDPLRTMPRFQALLAAIGDGSGGGAPVAWPG
ncbi:MAG: tetratricopeptide repeat protein [Alphaproteobacteria bacterium]|nr:tetratricopeptide repeat protein [Alphaproteobacteria bacterium]